VRFQALQGARNRVEAGLDVLVSRKTALKGPGAGVGNHNETLITRMVEKGAKLKGPRRRESEREAAGMLIAGGGNRRLVDVDVGRLRNTSEARAKLAIMESKWIHQGRQR